MNSAQLNIRHTPNFKIAPDYTERVAQQLTKGNQISYGTLEALHQLLPSPDSKRLWHNRSFHTRLTPVPNSNGTLVDYFNSCYSHLHHQLTYIAQQPFACDFTQQLIKRFAGNPHTVDEDTSFWHTIIEQLQYLMLHHKSESDHLAFVPRLLPLRDFYDESLDPFVEAAEVYRLTPKPPPCDLSKILVYEFADCVAFVNNTDIPLQVEELSEPFYWFTQLQERAQQLSEFPTFATGFASSMSPTSKSNTTSPPENTSSKSTSAPTSTRTTSDSTAFVSNPSSSSNSPPT
eukprot:gene16346-17985_t